MSISVLLITHEQVGAVILDAAKVTLGECPLDVGIVDVARECDPEERLEEACQAVKKLDRGDGVLVLTDLYGATPSNISSRLLGRFNVRVIAGLTLGMLIRVLNYPEKDLDELTTKAIAAAKDGVLEITTRF